MEPYRVPTMAEKDDIKEVLVQRFQSAFWKYSFAEDLILVWSGKLHQSSWSTVQKLVWSLMLGVAFAGFVGVSLR